MVFKATQHENEAGIYTILYAYPKSRSAPLDDNNFTALWWPCRTAWKTLVNPSLSRRFIEAPPCWKYNTE